MTFLSCKVCAGSTLEPKRSNRVRGPASHRSDCVVFPPMFIVLPLGHRFMMTASKSNSFPSSHPHIFFLSSFFFSNLYSARLAHVTDKDAVMSTQSITTNVLWLRVLNYLALPLAWMTKRRAGGLLWHDGASGVGRVTFVM